MKEEIADFWDEKDKSTRKEIVKILSGYLEIPVSSFLVEIDFDGLPVLQKNLLKRYYEQYILPQKGKQQIKYDGIIEEDLPSEFVCPRCGAPARQVMQTKRGIHYKCINSNCKWDSNRPFDFSKKARSYYVAKCAQLLKNMFPMCNIIGNVPYSPDAVLTGEFRGGTTNYDFSIWFRNHKLGRCRVELNKNITQEQFMTTKHNIYVIGRKTIVNKLADKDGLVIHFLIDEPDIKIGMSSLKTIRDNCPQGDDKFGNIQYIIPKELRPLVVIFDWEKMKRLIGLGKYWDSQTKNMLIK